MFLFVLSLLYLYFRFSVCVRSNYPVSITQPIMPFLCFQQLHRVPAPDLKYSRLFHSIIQGLLPVDHSIAYNPTRTGEKTHRFEVFVHDVY